MLISMGLAKWEQHLPFLRTNILSQIWRGFAFAHAHDQKQYLEGRIGGSVLTM